ncbi:hypothetical protein J6590_041750 [Homalodisca vitripennis]|nr:hypothetical protein J6590_041750 [Homalodisca vitripennis]
MEVNTLRQSCTIILRDVTLQRRCRSYRIDSIIVVNHRYYSLESTNLLGSTPERSALKRSST